MKKIEAIIKCFRLEDVKEELVQFGVKGMTVTEVKGFARQRGHTEIYRGSEYEVDFLPKMHIAVYCSDEMCEELCNAIQKAARTGKIGDGVIAVSSVESFVRIRTGEKDNDVLSRTAP